MFRTVKSVVKSAGKGMKDGLKNDPEIRKVVNKFPRTFSFIKKRLTPDEVFGLHLTIGIAISAIFTYFFLSILQDFFRQDVLIMADLRLINIVRSFRGPLLNQEMLFITYLGKTEIVLLGLAAVGIYLFFIKHWRYLLTLFLSVGLGELFVYAVKHLVNRTRPPLSLALVSEGTQFSFPSGHAFVAVSLYGMLAYFIFRAVKKRWMKILDIVFFVLLIGLIGFSRIYLGVHWPSDVLASFAASIAWITILITILEIRRKFDFGKNLDMPKKSTLIRLGTVLFFIWAVFIGFYYATHSLAKTEIPQKENNQIINISKQDIPNNFFNNLPRVSENLGGKPMEPINIIVIGGQNQLDKVFKDSGWLPSDRINAQSIGKLILATLSGRSYAQAPGVPSLWDTKPNDLGYEKPTQTVKEREHIHFWETPFLVDGKTPVWFGTVHFDQAIKLQSSMVFPTHSIDPAIDNERDKLKDELNKTGEISDYQEFQIVSPTMGKNQVGDIFFTDGKAYIFYLK